MNSSKFRFTLDLHSIQSQYHIPVMLGDTSVTLLISITDGGVPFVISDGCLAKLSIKRPTGTYIEEFCKIKNNSVIEYPFRQNENTCAVKGMHLCDVTLYGPDGAKVGGPRFTMSVSEGVVGSNDIGLTDEDWRAVDAMMSAEVDRVNAENARVKAEAARAEAAEEAIERAEAAAKKAEDAASGLGGSGGSSGSSEDGATFTPDVSEDGVISWTNDKGLDNPGPVNLKGKDGKSAYDYAKDGGYTGTEAEFAEKMASEAPVQSVNGKKGAVTLSATDVGARPSNWTPSYSDVGADKSGTADTKVATHNTNGEAHNDLRLLITGLTTRLNSLADSDDTTLDQLSEIVAYITSNKSLIDSITTGKVNVSDIIDNLTTSVSNKPLSAKQGVQLKALIDAITIPTKISQLDNDKGYITLEDLPVYDGSVS